MGRQWKTSSAFVLEISNYGDQGSNQGNSWLESKYASSVTQQTCSEKVKRGWAGQQWLELIKWSRLTKKKSLTFWVRTWCVRGNVWDDWLVGMATMETGQAMDLVDILNDLREAGWVKDVITLNLQPWPYCKNIKCKVGWPNKNSQPGD